MAKVLVIEDDPEMRRTVRRILEAGGHDVVEAGDGRSGLRLFREETPDLVVTDIVMPDQEGLETIKMMMAERPQTRVVAMSGGGSDGGVLYLTLATQLGAHEVLLKPFRPEALTSAVDRILARD